MSKLASSVGGSPLPTTTAPGRELDALIAEKLFDYEWRVSESSGRRCVYPKGMHPQRMSRLADKTEPLVLDWDAEHVRWTPAFSTDIAAAWLVVEKMAERGFTCDIEWKGVGRVYEQSAEVSFSHAESFEHRGHGVHDSAPAAICFAALRALANAQPVSPEPDTPT